MQERRNYSYYLILIICSMSAFVTPFMGSSVNIALPVIGKDLNVDAVLLAWVSNVYNLAAAMFLLPLGRLADLKGREIIFKIGMSLFPIASVACAFAWSAYSLVTFRLFQGIGGAMIFGTANAILSASYPKEERGKVLGIGVTAVYIGIASGPVIGGFLVTALGWRSLFGVVGVLSLVTAVLAVTCMKNTPVDKKGTLDMPGSVVYCVALTLIMFGFPSLPALKGWLYLVGGTAGFIAFGVIELKSASPILDIRVFRGNGPFIFSNLAELIGYAATFTVGFLLSFYLQDVKGLSPEDAGLVLVIQTVMIILFSKKAGSLSDKIEPAILAAVGMGLSAIGIGALIPLSAATPIWFIVVCMGVIGLGLSLFTSPITNAVMSSVEKKDLGLASSALASMRTLGMNLSMGIIMMLFSIMMGRTQITPEYYGAFVKSARAGFLIFTLLCLAAIFFLLTKGRVRRKAAPAFADAETFS